MFTSPLAGFLLGMGIITVLYLVIFSMMRAGGPLARMAKPRWVNAFFGKAQIVSAAYMGFAHGRQDAQKTMGIIALVVAAGTARGGWRIIKTLG